MQRGLYLPVIEGDDGVYINKSGDFLYFAYIKKFKVYLRSGGKRWSIEESYDYLGAHTLKSFNSLMLIGVEDGL